MLQEGTLFANRYRLLKEQGSGSFGEVWLAQDEQLDNMQVAVKVYIALDDRGIEEFKKEYKTAYGLNHPNLLHAYHFDICDKRPYLVMPYCPDSALSLIGHCDRETLWQLIKDVSSGLAYLHSLDIVHHDIKPDNILRKEDGTFVITDFGISTKMRSTLRRNSRRAMNHNDSAGSLPYMGPEMFSDTPQSVKATDIWAFGATLYEIITGDLPFFGQGGVMQMNGAQIPKFEYEDDNIIRLTNSCLSINPWDRPMAADIVIVSQSHSFSLNQSQQEIATHQWSKSLNIRQNAWLWLMSLAILAFAVGIFRVYNKPNPKEPIVEEMRHEYALTGVTDGHEWVDLGLSVKWATCNLGALTPEDYGDYFAWGETVPRDKFTEENYKFFSGWQTIDLINIQYTVSKYNDADKKTQLDIEDDAARYNWGAAWRMPTMDEMKELMDSCTCTLTIQDGVNGALFVSKVNGNSLFLPAAGSKGEMVGQDIGRGFGYKSSTIGKGLGGFIIESSGFMFLRVEGLVNSSGGPIRAITEK